MRHREALDDVANAHRFSERSDFRNFKSSRRRRETVRGLQPGCPNRWLPALSEPRLLAAIDDNLPAITMRPSHAMQSTSVQSSRSMAALRHGNPRWRMSNRSSSLSFEVACRSMASSRSARRHAGCHCQMTADQRRATRNGYDFNLSGAGINRILDEFLDDAGGPLDHFTGCDAVDRFRSEAA